MVDIRKSESCGYTVFELRGEVSDPKVLQKIEKSIDREIESGHDSVAIDLHMCEYINSGLIGFFLGWKKKQDERGLQFCLIEPNEKSMEVLRLCGIPDVIRIYRNDVDFQRNARP